MEPTSIRAHCQQYGTILHFGVIGNIVYVRYETEVHAQNACMDLNGKIMMNCPVHAEVSSESECSKAMESAVNTPTAVPITNQVTIAAAFPNISSFGGLWTTTGQAVPPAPPQQYLQQAFPATYGVPTTIGLNGGFSHWGMPNAQTVLPNASQLWAAAPPQQPANMFPAAYPGWLATKQDTPVQAFSPGMDRCLPSKLFNPTEQGS